MELYCNGSDDEDALYSSVKLGLNQVNAAPQASAANIGQGQALKAIVINRHQGAPNLQSLTGLPTFLPTIFTILAAF
ncbi:hypothetical protein [Leptolyngbya subtilissima]|uniref:hypothetical protein n=1 Tax=Leptolyngbya subtilissima TaxID=1346803 RepID=UPI003298BADD